MNKRSITGFGCGFLLFISLNIIAVHLASDCGLATFSPSSPCADAIARLGWPLRFYESGGFIYRQSFNSFFLLIDLWVGIALAVGMGLLFSVGKKPLPK